jgi:hypothetical protein
MQNSYLASFKDLDQRIKALRTITDTADGDARARERIVAMGSRHIAECAMERAHTAFGHGDNDGCEACVRFAIEMDETIIASPVFAKLKWKRRIGIAGTNLLRRVYRPLRSRLITADHV